MPLVPFHGWLAESYKSMPIPVVAVFSAILSKVAAYGFLRVVLPLFPYASVHYQTLLLVIAVVSILWGTAVAFTTTDARLVVAYSSVAQLGFITLGIFSLRPEGAQGALLQMLNHGLVTAPLFFIVGLVLSGRAIDFWLITILALALGALAPWWVRLLTDPRYQRAEKGVALLAFASASWDSACCTAFHCRAARICCWSAGDSVARRCGDSTALAVMPLCTSDESPA